MYYTDFTAETDDWRIYCLENAPSYLAGHPNTGGVYIDENNVSHVFYVPDEDEVIQIV